MTWTSLPPVITGRPVLILKQTSRWWWWWRCWCWWQWPWHITLIRIDKTKDTNQFHLTYPLFSKLNQGMINRWKRNRPRQCFYFDIKYSYIVISIVIPIILQQTTVSSQILREKSGVAWAKVSLHTEMRCGGKSQRDQFGQNCPQKSKKGHNFQWTF